MYRFRAFVIFILLCFVPQLLFALSGDEFYYEDFSATEEGLLPEEWKGGKNMAVENDQGENVLKRFEPGDINVETANLEFPENYTLDIDLKLPTIERYFIGKYEVILGNMAVKFGDIKRGDSGHYVTISLGGSRGKLSQITLQYEALESDGKFAGFVAPCKISIQKKGPVVKVYINDERVILGRYAVSQQKTVRFKANKYGLIISKIVATEN